ncbi:MAG TPA: hypothetical protein VGH98_19995 [Gemmatimonadaceae bacterium]|jgi:hypothetical protein
MLAARVLVVLLLGAAPLQAQTPPDTAANAPAEWLIGMSLGFPGVRSQIVPELFTFGLNFTQVCSGRIGGDIAFGTMPWLFANGIIAFGFRGDVTVPLVRPHFILLPSAGVSAIGAFTPGGGGGGGGVAGLNAGIAAVVHSHGVGLRTGVTVHKFFGLDTPVWLLEVGFVSIGIDPP